MNIDRIIIVAAGQGSRLRPLTDSIPKCLVPLHGKPLLHWQLAAIWQITSAQIVVVGGYRIDQIDFPGIILLRNSEYDTTNMVATMWSAREWFGNGFLLAYGDIVYNPAVLASLLQGPHDIAVVIDRKWRSYWQRRGENILNDAESLRIDAAGRIISIGQRAEDETEIEGQYIGMVAFRGGGIEQMKTLIQNEQNANRTGRTIVHASRPFRELYMTDLLQGLINHGVEVWPVWVDGGWLEIDTPVDLFLAAELSSVSNGSLLIER